MSRKMAELRPRFFQAKNFNSAFIKDFKDFLNNFELKKAYVGQQIQDRSVTDQI
jgi:hypothetical protein